MAGLVEPELPDYIFNDLFPMESEINNWVNHDFWYTNQCIDHYDSNRFPTIELPLSIDTTPNAHQPIDQSASSPLSTFSSASVNSQPALNGLLVAENRDLSQNSPAAMNVDNDNPIQSLYVVGGDRMFVASPSISIQSPSISIQSPTSSNVFSESCYSSPPMTPSSDADCAFNHEGQMIDYLRSDKGIDMFAKAHDVSKTELMNFFEMKKHGDDVDSQGHKSPVEHEEKNDTHHKRRRHRGTYSKNTCLQVIEFVKKGYSARAAAKKFGIPKSTVHNWLHEDVTTRPEKGHRKKDLFPDKHEDVEHEYQKNVTELGNSLAQTSLKDESMALQNCSSLVRIKKEELNRPEIAQDFNVRPETNHSSQLVKLLTSNNNKMAKIKTEPASDNIEKETDDNYLNIDWNFDELLHPEDWIEHEQWYKQQYLHHYDHYYNKENNAKNRKCYGSYSNEHRIKATEYVRSGNTLSAASKEFNIPKSTIHTWLNEGNTPCELPTDVENAVVDQIEQGKDGETSPNLIVIKKKAEEVASPRVDKFRPSFAWCRDFMKRHYMDKPDAVDSKRICRENGDDHKPSISDLVSVLGLAPNHPEHATEVTGSMI